MPRQFAITIGINHYRYHRYGLGALKFAENDAVAMQAYLKEIGFEEVYRYSDTSPSIEEESTVPERTNLLTILDRIENQHFLKADDCFWFFFSLPSHQRLSHANRWQSPPACRHRHFNKSSDPSTQKKRSRKHCADPGYVPQ